MSNNAKGGIASSLASRFSTLISDRLKQGQEEIATQMDSVFVANEQLQAMIEQNVAPYR